MAGEYTVTKDYFLPDPADILPAKGLVVYVNIVDGVRIRRWQTRNDFFIAHSRATKLIQQFADEDERAVLEMGG